MQRNLYSYQIGSNYSSHLARCWLEPGARFLVAVFIPQLVSLVSAPLLSQMYINKDVSFCLHSIMGLYMLICVTVKRLGT